MILNPHTALTGSPWVVEAWENGARFCLRAQPQISSVKDESKIEAKLFEYLASEIQKKPTRCCMSLSSRDVELISRRLPELLPEEFRFRSREQSSTAPRGLHTSNEALWTVHLDTSSSSNPSVNNSPQAMNLARSFDDTHTEGRSVDGEPKEEGEPSVPSLLNTQDVKPSSRRTKWSKVRARHLFRSLLKVNRLYIEGLGDPKVCNLSVFSSLQYLVVDGLPVQYLRSLLLLKPQLKELIVKRAFMDSPYPLLDPGSATHLDKHESSWNKNCLRRLRTSRPWCNLGTLKLAGCGLTETDPSLSLLTAVTNLDLSNNQLTKLPGALHFQGCCYLSELNLSHNKLGSRSGPFSKVKNSLGSLRVLNLSHNQLKTIEGLSKLYSLEHLDLGHNEIQELRQIAHIALLPCLMSVVVEGNPLTRTRCYRYEVWCIFHDVRCQWPGWGRGSRIWHPSDRISTDFCETSIVPAPPTLDGRSPTLEELRRLRYRQRRQSSSLNSAPSPSVQTYPLSTASLAAWDKLITADKKDSWDEATPDTLSVPQPGAGHGMRRRRRSQVRVQEATIEDLAPEPASFLQERERQHRMALLTAAAAPQPRVITLLPASNSEEDQGAHSNDRVPASPFPMLPHGSLPLISETEKSKEFQKNLVSSSSADFTSPDVAFYSPEPASINHPLNSLESVQTVEEDWKEDSQTTDGPTESSPFKTPKSSDDASSMVTAAEITDDTDECSKSGNLIIAPGKDGSVDPSLPSFGAVSPLLASLISPVTSSLPKTFETPPVKSKSRRFSAPGSADDEVKPDYGVSAERLSEDYALSGYIGKPELSTLVVHDNVELYFQEQVFNPKLPRPYLRPSLRNMITSQKIVAIYREPVLPQNRLIPGLYGRGTYINVDGDEGGTIILERSCLLVLTDAYFFLIEENWKRQARFSEAPMPRVIRHHPLWSISAVHLGFDFQTIGIAFQEDKDQIADMQAQHSIVPFSKNFSDAYLFLTRDKERTMQMVNNIRPLVNEVRQAWVPQLPKVLIQNNDEDFLRNIFNIVKDQINSEVVLYQMLFQRWKRKPQVLIPRSLIVLRSGEILLCDENYVQSDKTSRPLNRPLKCEGHTLLRDVEKIRLEENPLQITLILNTPSLLIRRKRKWRLVGRTRRAVQRVANELSKLQQLYSLKGRKFSSGHF